MKIHFIKAIVYCAINIGIFSASASIPTVYDRENTSESYPKLTFKNFQELPEIPTLPDPFTFTDGTRSTDFADWERHRSEILQYLWHYELGQKPYVYKDSIDAVFSNDTLTVTVHENGKTLSLHSNIIYPKGEGPFPIVIGVGFPTGSLPKELFLDNGVAAMAFDFPEVMSHTQKRGEEPINHLYPDNTEIGAYSAWPWGISRLIDGLEKVAENARIDLKHIAVTGCSFAGKMALYAGAMDERIALTIAQEPGGGGVNAWRVSETLGNVERVGNTNYAWFLESMRQFADSNVNRLPIDHHQLAALVAPRALLILGNTDYEWLADESGYVASRAAKEVWTTFGISERMGYSIEGGHPHCQLPLSQYPEVTAFIRSFLLDDNEMNTDIERAPMFDYVDWQQWAPWSSMQHKPLIIWQWMDGLVTKEGITRDLEAFKEAGLAGVQNFQIGGPQQMRIGNPDNAIGSYNWKELLKWTLDECERLGLTFGTHNCPGWSSSAYRTVMPEYSMQTLVFTETPYKRGSRNIKLLTPEVDPQWNYYEDVAVLAITSDSTATLDQIVDLTRFFNPIKNELKLPKNIRLPENASFLRIGQTTNGKTNEAQAPETGRGLECDKLSREAVKAFWDGYPTMMIETAGRHSGKTFTHFEIDSYEAGGQTWSPVLPAEFKKRKGYDIIPYLPFMIGRLKEIESKENTAKFLKDWESVVTDCVAENYYGYMTHLANEAGVRMMIEPYGTGGQKPFRIIDFEKIVQACESADIATEFWQDPPRWGWKDIIGHEKSMRKLGKPLLMAEAFTCWPLKAWSDSPADIKKTCDKAFCSGVNRMMLHAGAANPWPNVEPGMSFGIWGTQFVPGQTWWKAGGAKELFGYMTRCQSLLQRGIPSPEQLPRMDSFLSYRRTDGNTDIIFVCNQSDTTSTETIPFDTQGRSVEVFDPYSMTRYSIDPSAPLEVEIEQLGSRFLIIRPGMNTLPSKQEWTQTAAIPVEGTWSLSFPEIGDLPTDSLFSWTESDLHDVKYFSGTAKYTIPFSINKNDIKPEERMVLSLGEVKDMASVVVNEKQMPLLWKAPFECDITDAVNDGENMLEIEITNLWPNRMIGDELEPDDLEWSEPLVYDYAPGQPRAGCYLTSNPDWLRKGTERPSKGRKSVGCFKFFTADSPLLPSGLLGPVSIKTLLRQKL